MANTGNTFPSQDGEMETQLGCSCAVLCYNIFFCCYFATTNQEKKKRLERIQHKHANAHIHTEENRDLK